MKKAMASSSRKGGKDLCTRIPRKRMLDVKQLVAVDDVRSIGNRKADKWNWSTAMDRIEGDLKLYKGLVDVIVSLVKEEGDEEEASCSKIPMNLISYMIKLKFDEDNFLTSEHILFIYIGFVSYTTTV